MFLKEVYSINVRFWSGQIMVRVSSGVSGLDEI